uniref:D(1B) dopamine receptor-like isoform X1 n=1 Tax=Styela clava TaxID=7725 RepID=UPI0019398791|nr:D(1B) dopamine receptor-like isoform X1 [Styela clava]
MLQLKHHLTIIFDLRGRWMKEPNYRNMLKTLQTPIHHRELIPIFTFLGFSTIFGTVANGITFMVIHKMKKTAFNIFIMSLCVSDFLSSINSSFMTYRSLKGFDDYRLPLAFCKLGIAVDFWTSISTIQHILIFSCLRFYCVKFPHRYGNVTISKSKCLILTVWAETMLVGFVVYLCWPGFEYIDDSSPVRYKCDMTEIWAPTMFWYAMVAFPILIYAPMILIMFVCLAIAIVLIHRKRKLRHIRSVRNDFRKSEKFALIQLALIVVSFLLGYSADVSYRVTAIASIQRGKPLLVETEVVFSLVSHCVLRLSECLNPIFYNFASSELRHATVNFLNGGCRMTSHTFNRNIGIQARASRINSISVSTPL